MRESKSERTGNSEFGLEFVPITGSIVDITHMRRYVENVQVLKAASDSMGWRTFMENCVFMVIDLSLDPMENLMDFFAEDVLDRILELGVHEGELHYELGMLQDYRYTTMMEGLSVAQQMHYDEYGYEIKRWFSDTEVLVESSFRTGVDRNGSTARRYHRTFSKVGRDTGRQGCDRVSRRDQISGSDIPY